MIASLYEPFRIWSDGGSVWVISDTHFGDADCRLMDPGWIGPDEQVAILNRYVRKGDTLVHLGDVGDASYMDRVRSGHKVLITGNHDRLSDVRGHFDEIYDGVLVIAPKIVLSHEPVPVAWAVNVHGHDHADGFDFGRCRHVNLAANVCGYVPMNLGHAIKHGLCAGIDGIHRITIDRATERKAGRA